MTEVAGGEGTRRWSRQAVRFGVSSLLALLAFAGAFIPPYSVPGILGMGLPVGLVEGWWYSLPEPSRSMVLYDVGTSLAHAIYPITFGIVSFLWIPHPDRPTQLFPRRTVCLLASVTALSALFHLLAWRPGMEGHQASEFLALIGVNLGLPLLLGALWWSSANSQSWPRSIAIHAALFAWVATSAFPWIGELP